VTEDPADFEWRNLKKLIVLVLSSLVWKSPTVQNQIREYGGVETILSCTSYDGT
jgi:palmitoyltransferase